MTDEDGGSLAVVKAVGGSALWAAGAASSYVGGAISSYVAGSSSEAKPEPACLRPLGGSEILRIANTLNGIFATSNGALKPPEVPRLVVVGTQVGVMWASKLHVHTCTCTPAHLHTCTPAHLHTCTPELGWARGEGATPVPHTLRSVPQSSGKSSLLNGIMAADILPLGEQMVTRTLTCSSNLPLTGRPGLRCC